MTLETTLRQRANNRCELCGATENLSVYLLPPEASESPDNAVLLCDTCRGQIEGKQEWQPERWRGLSETMWSTTEPVQIMAWRVLKQLSGESWAQDLLDMLYLDDDILARAQAGLAASDGEESIVHRDSNGAVLAAGDTVTLTKDLNVKGANFTAKRGTAVRGISLVADNPEQIEGKINGQRIVILTRFVKKS
jgi:protein PhnA